MKQQGEGWTKKDQPQEPELKGGSTMSHGMRTYRGNCTECDAEGSCFGHRTELPTHSELISYVEHRLPAPKELSEREAADVKAMYGCYPQYIGGPKDGQRADYGGMTGLRSNADESDEFPDYWCRPHLDKFRYHSSVIADPRRWEKLMEQYVTMEAAGRKELAAKHRADKAERAEEAKRAATQKRRSRTTRRK